MGFNGKGIQDYQVFVMTLIAKKALAFDTGTHPGFTPYAHDITAGTIGTNIFIRHSHVKSFIQKECSAA